MRRRGTSIVTPVERIERRLHTGDSWQERQSRAMLTSWLAASDEGADLWLQYEELVTTESSKGAILSFERGRNTITSIVNSLYAQEVQGN
jgi:hypothetical protein